MIDKGRVKERTSQRLRKLDRERYARNSAGGIVFITDVSGSDSFRGNFWVEFAQSGNERNAYTVDWFDSRSDAERKAREVEEVML